MLVMVCWKPVASLGLREAKWWNVAGSDVWVALLTAQAE
jgi:hypothetical protein